MDVFAYLIPYGLEWLNLIVRWLHMITGIAWIGASFYFVWLDNSIRAPAPGSPLALKGVSGELWAVHGGGFYNPQKYLVAPAELPKDLHWFKWEAYSTWLSGIALLTIAYYFNAQAMMIDKSVADLSSWQAIGVGVGMLALGWTVYDLLCRSPLARHELWFGVVVFALVVAAAYALTHLLSGRAAYIHVGAMIGTIMVGNVLMLIIPGQRKMVEAMAAGKLPDPVHGQRAKQRSVHNNYFTLPVLFIMISNHYAMTYRNERGWLVLACIMAAGVFIRHFFNLRHKGRVVWGYPLLGVALLVGVAVAIAPPAPVARAANDPAAQFAKVQAVVTQRCATCHAAAPTQPGFATAPAGVMLDSAAQIRQHSEQIYKQAVQLKAMPIGNLTQMTDAERALLGAWFESGAK
ncbi:putative membrane protein [Janthinobacterium sp. CG_23.3]|uniref:urate hydroxylase PuuD n=1 Tax=unclassified Janthinobacterium TaxID=2610881 RepID=UPI00034B0D1E|nr:MULTISPECIES: urate hydroxylase PuuD [unclassified Janthinobacterium]MEC5163339.1 putative membrane protein [Janthinobacterium sp. CG_S6]